MLMRSIRALMVSACGLVAATASAQTPEVFQGDVYLKEFRFTSGDTLQNLKLHYRTVGRPVRDAQGVVTNAVLILHGTGGTGAQFIRPEAGCRPGCGASSIRTSWTR